jgi:hypothetical protein
LPKRREGVGYEPLDVAIHDAIGTELSLDPPVDTHRHHAVDVPRAWAERKSIQYMACLLASRELARGGHGARDRSRERIHGPNSASQHDRRCYNEWTCSAHVLPPA